MKPEFILQWLKALFRELYLHRWWVLGCFTVTVMSVVIVGVFWPKHYQSSGTIHADSRNIIAPLLRGSAEVASIDTAQSRVVREVLFSQRMIALVAKQVGMLKGGEPTNIISSVHENVREGIEIKDVGNGYMNISYTAKTAKEAFEVVNFLIDNFIKNSADTKRRESKDAYQFIDRQVNSYKRQLQEAEEKLKEFHSANVDGTEASVNARIAQLRATIVEMELDLDEDLTRKTELSAQLQQESRFLTQSYRADIYRERLSKAQSQLETLRLSFQDTYPDIISLKHQIEDMRRAVVDAETGNSGVTEGGSGESSLNPFYQELRGQLSEIEVNIRTRKKRLVAVKVLLDEEYERSKRIASHQAELSEFTRDYDVTRNIYEDMLERKERARLSMTLDMEGRGVSYKIQEPPTYPLSPTGLRFMYFALAGIPLGLLAAIGVVAVYIQLDPRLRFAAGLMDEINIPVLGSIPHYASAMKVRLFRGETILFGLAFLLVVSAYASVVALKALGYI